LPYVIALAALFVHATLFCAPLTGVQRPNMLLLTVDSFRPDYLGCYGHRRAITPNIDRLAGEGVLFTRAYSTAAWTNPSLVSLLTGLYPSVHGVERREESVPDFLVTALENLAGDGYYVPEINYLFPMPNYRNLGFTPSAYRDLPKFLAACRDTTFFAWYHFHGPHLPYSPPAKFFKKFLSARKVSGKALEAVMANILMPRGEYSFTPREQEVVKALYDGEVAAQDEEIGLALKALDSLGLREQTIVVLSADHGEELFDHGWLGHASTSFSGTLFDELIHIPLIIRWPSHLPQGLRVDSLVQSVDIMPTLFELAGLELEAPCQGRSFLRLLTGKKEEISGREAVFCETSVCGYQCPDSIEPEWLRCARTSSYKLIQYVSPGELPRYALFDLTADPGEKMDVAEKSPEETERLKGLLFSWMFVNQRLRSSIATAQAARQAIAGHEDIFRDIPQVQIVSPGENEVLTYASNSGKVQVSWTGPAEGEYIIEYEVGQGKYHLQGSFPVTGNSQTYGPFNPVFWKGLTLYNPFSFRVLPRGHPDLASSRRSFTFQ